MQLWKRKWTRAALALLCLLTTTSAGAAPLLYVVREFDPELRVVDASDASTQSTQTITLAGQTVLGANGLARHPATGVYYALLELQGQAGRQLVTLNGQTGVATSIGDTGDFFTGLAFDGSGTLYGITHDDAASASEIHTLSLADATTSFVVAVGDDLEFGEALGFNPDDGLLYRMSGEPAPFGTQLLESIDPGSLTRTAISTSGDSYDEALGLTYFGGNTFYMTDYLGGPGSGGVSDLYQLSAGGLVTRIGHLGFSDARGLAIVPEPSSLVLLAVGLVGLAARRRERS